MGIETSDATTNEETKLGDNFIEDINKYNYDIQNIVSNPILKQDGRVDYVKTQEAIDNIEANMPDGLQIKNFEDSEDLNLAISGLSEEDIPP